MKKDKIKKIIIIIATIISTIIGAKNPEIGKQLNNLINITNMT
jgi:hypothetical protein